MICEKRYALHVRFQDVTPAPLVTVMIGVGSARRLCCVSLQASEGFRGDRRASFPLRRLSRPNTSFLGGECSWKGELTEREGDGYSVLGFTK